MDIQSDLRTRETLTSHQHVVCFATLRLASMCYEPPRFLTKERKHSYQ